MNFEDVRRLRSGSERHIVRRSSAMMLSSSSYTNRRVTNEFSLVSIGVWKEFYLVSHSGPSKRRKAWKNTSYKFLTFLKKCLRLHKIENCLLHLCGSLASPATFSLNPNVLKLIFNCISLPLAPHHLCTKNRFFICYRRVVLTRSIWKWLKF